MRASGRNQIGLQTNIVENPIGREVGCSVGRGSSRSMNAPQRIGNLRGEVRVGVAIAQLRLPERIAVRRQELHRERPGRFVETQQLRRRVGDSGVGALHPSGLVAVALDRRLPVRRHPQLRQCALDADRARGKVDPPDIR